MHRVKSFTEPKENSHIANIFASVALTAVNTDTYISPIGGSAPVFPSLSGEVLRVSSANPADAGVTIRIDGLDANLTQISEEVVLTATTVDTTLSFARVNNALVIAAANGTVQESVGLISVQDTTQTNTYRTVSVDSQLSEDSAYTIHKGQGWSFLGLISSMTRTASQAIGLIEIHVRYLTPGAAVSPVYRPFRFGLLSAGNSIVSLENYLYEKLNAPADVWLSAEADASNVSIAVRYTLDIDD